MKCAVRIELDRAPAHPSRETIRTTSHRLATEGRILERRIRSRLQEMRRYDAYLRAGVEELLRRARVEPEHGRQSVARGNRIDSHQQRTNRGPDVLRDVHAIAVQHVRGAHGNAIVP